MNLPTEAGEVAEKRRISGAKNLWPTKGTENSVPERENCDGASYLVKVRVIVVSCWNKGGAEAEYNWPYPVLVAYSESPDVQREGDQ